MKNIDKRNIALTAFSLMVTLDVQDVEKDYYRIHDMVKSMCSQRIGAEKKKKPNPLEVASATNNILNPLWEFYFKNYSDGHIVTIR